MDAAAVEAVVNHYQGGIYDENGNLVTAQRDELTGAMAGGPALESANGRTIGRQICMSERFRMHLQNR